MYDSIAEKHEQDVSPMDSEEDFTVREENNTNVPRGKSDLNLSL